VANREFLMLAKTLDSDNYSDVVGWYMSEKLDGMRAWWDGGLTKGMPAEEVPFANTEKDDRLKEKVIATGLWSRYGKVVRAPASWLDSLPPYSLDGELWTGRHQWEYVISIVKKHKGNDANWAKVAYRVFDCPPINAVLADGTINNTNFQKVFSGAMNFKSNLNIRQVIENTPFNLCYNYLRSIDFSNSPIVVHEQETLPLNVEAVKLRIEEKLEDVCLLGGEGLMLRDPNSIWIPKRMKQLLKIKKLLDSEAEIIGYTSGRATEKGSKLLGMIGNLIVIWGGKVFELSGYTDEERSFKTPEMIKWAEENPDRKCPDSFDGKYFHVGEKVTFLYRDLTDAGIPKEARYFRKRVDE